MRNMYFREQDTIRVGSTSQLSISDVNAIQNISRRLTKNLSKPTHNGLKFQQYCGIVSTGEMVIELLPKIDPKIHTVEQSRGILVAMLSRVGELMPMPEHYKKCRSSCPSLLDVVSQDFCNKILASFADISYEHRAEKAGNVPTVRGRMEFLSHLKIDSVNSSSFLCRYDKEDVNNDYNKALKFILRTLHKQPVSDVTRSKITRMLNFFNDVSDCRFSSRQLKLISRDPKVSKWKCIFKRASELVEGAPLGGGGRVPTDLTLLFNMNALFQNVVTRCVMIRCKELSNGGLVVKLPVESRSLTESAFTMRPDIAISRSGGKVVLVLDAKWKQLNRRSKTCGISMSDINQLIVYALGYQCNSASVIFPASSTFSSHDCKDFSISINPPVVVEVVALDLDSLSFSGDVGSKLENTILTLR